ncbi:MULTISPECIES: hypothetical protein [Halomonadaceae]|uniref:Uncharacterized protein n=1 Tax=Vreelandella alkaliphila TaxID=272774 RepID=A0AAJ2RZ02_9GAMM|nr:MULTISPECIES: hypothetical protein [Halomonas]MDX5979099.1 hypothetical protein [Halomonas alkaliphila]
MKTAKNSLTHLFDIADGASPDMALKAMAQPTPPGHTASTLPALY